jgi:hypothetical protein
MNQRIPDIAWKATSCNDDWLQLTQTNDSLFKEPPPLPMSQKTPLGKILVQKYISEWTSTRSVAQAANKRLLCLMNKQGIKRSARAVKHT